MKTKVCQGQCPACGSYDIEVMDESSEVEYIITFTCEECGELFCETYKYADTTYDYDM